MLVTRRQGREWALQVLVQFDLVEPEAVDGAIAAFWEQQTELEAEMIEEAYRETPPLFTSTNPAVLEELAKMRAFAEERIRGVWFNRTALDVLIPPYLENWSLYRLGTVERSALRLGAWELQHCDIPAPIVINESVDLAKFFSTTKSGRFVNGILDRLGKQLRAAPAGKDGETFTP
jgi:transcription antitermination factor NusB